MFLLIWYSCNQWSFSLYILLCVEHLVQRPLSTKTRWDQVGPDARCPESNVNSIEFYFIITSGKTTVYHAAFTLARYVMRCNVRPLIGAGLLWLVSSRVKTKGPFLARSFIMFIILSYVKCYVVLRILYSKPTWLQCCWTRSLAPNYGMLKLWCQSKDGVFSSPRVVRLVATGQICNIRKSGFQHRLSLPSFSLIF